MSMSNPYSHTTHPSVSGTASDKATIANMTYPAALQKGTPAQVLASGTLSETVSGGNLYIYALIGGVKLPFPGMDHNLCNDGFACPSAAGAFNFDYKITIPSAIPSFKALEVLFLATDSNNNELFCVGVQVAVTDADTPLGAAPEVAGERIAVRSKARIH
jgi:hypothetical protein